MTKSYSDSIDVLLNSSLPSLKKLEGERELIIQYSIEIINIFSKTIESSHTGDKEKAINYLNQAKIILKKLRIYQIMLKDLTSLEIYFYNLNKNM